MKHTKKIWFCLFVIAISSLVSGCGSGSSTDSNSGNEGASAIVTVTDYSGIRVPGATVVLGDSNGAMKDYGVTDAKGQITFKNAPANATVTAATTCLRSGETTTTYSINVAYDVNGSIVLSLDNCAASPSILPPVSPSPSPLGTVTVNVTNTLGDVKRNQLSVGQQSFVSGGSLITRQTVTITTNDLDSDGTFSIVVKGFDAHLNTIAYGILLDQTFTDGMTVDISMELMSFVQFQISNLTATTGTLYASLGMYRNGKRGLWSDYSYPLSSAPSSTTINLAYIPGFGDSIGYELYLELDRDHDGITDAIQNLSMNPSAKTPSNQSFDLSKALPVPSVTVTGADTSTPTLSWSGVDPASTSIYVSAYMRSSTMDYIYLSFGDLMRSRTSIRYPELPDSLAAFRPNNVYYFSVDASAAEGSIYKWSSGSYQAPNP